MVLLPAVASIRPELLTLPSLMMAVVSSRIGAGPATSTLASTATVPKVLVSVSWSRVSFVPSPVTSMVPSLVNAPLARFLIVLLTPLVASSRPWLVTVPLSIVVVFSSSVDRWVASVRSTCTVPPLLLTVSVSRIRWLSPVARSLPALLKLTVWSMVSVVPDPVDSTMPAPVLVIAALWMVLLPAVASISPVLVTVPSLMMAVVSSRIGAGPATSTLASTATVPKVLVSVSWSRVSFVPSPCTSMVPSLTNAPLARFLIVLLTPLVASSRPWLVTVPLSIVVVFSSSVDRWVASVRSTCTVPPLLLTVSVSRIRWLSPVASSLPALLKLTVWSMLSVVLEPVDSTMPAPVLVIAALWMVLLPAVASISPVLVTAPSLITAVVSSRIGAGPATSTLASTATVPKVLVSVSWSSVSFVP